MSNRYESLRIVTGQDSPVLLPPAVAAPPGWLQCGQEAAVLSAADHLPGIRVGEGDGSGYIVRRSLDGQLLYVPDAGFTGTTTFTYSVDDGRGGVIEQAATVVVRPAGEAEGSVSFANGSRVAGVQEGVDAAVVGALSIDGSALGSHHDILIFEDRSESPSRRFSVTGDKLYLMVPLASPADDTIRLRVVAYEDNCQIANDELVIMVSPAVQAKPHPLLPELASQRSDDLLTADQDHFAFNPQVAHQTTPSSRDPFEEDQIAPWWGENPEITSGEPAVPVFNEVAPTMPVPEDFDPYSL